MKNEIPKIVAIIGFIIIAVLLCIRQEYFYAMICLIYIQFILQPGN